MLSLAGIFSTIPGNFYDLCSVLLASLLLLLLLGLLSNDISMCSERVGGVSLLGERDELLDELSEFSFASTDFGIFSIILTGSFSMPYFLTFSRYRVSIFTEWAGSLFLGRELSRTFLNKDSDRVRGIGWA